MRISIEIDSATTDQFRALVLALYEVRCQDEMTVRLNGPSMWAAKTMPLTPNQFAHVVGQLVQFRGVKIADLLPLHEFDEVSTV